MRKAIAVIIVICMVLMSAGDISAKARTSRNVRRQKQQTEQQIRLTDQQIKENARQLKSRLNDLNRLHAESQTLNISISQINATIDSLNSCMQQATDSIAALDARLGEMQAAFADILRSARRNRSAMSNLAFIFSSRSFTQAFRRANALKQFSKWRQRKADQINQVKSQLDERRRYIDTLKIENQKAVSDMASRRADLSAKQRETDNLVASLKGKDRDLRKILRDQQNQARALDRELDRIIKEEQRKAAIEEEKRRKREEEERRKAEQQRKADEQRKAEKSGKGKSSGAQSPEQPQPSAPAPSRPSAPAPALSGNFAANKGRLSYPVDPHNIVKRFGRQQHPLHKHVMTDNAGLDMETSQAAAVKCVFDGEVSAIFCPDGYNNVVLVRHGSYLTVYANLGSLSVRTGQKVKRGQQLGTVYVDTADGNRSVLHFEIRNARADGSVTKENPEVWLR